MKLMVVKLTIDIKLELEFLDIFVDIVNSFMIFSKVFKNLS